MRTHTGNIDSEQDGETAPEGALILLARLLARAAAREWAEQHLPIHVLGPGPDSDPTTTHSKGLLYVD